MPLMPVAAKSYVISLKGRVYILLVEHYCRLWHVLRLNVSGLNCKHGCRDSPQASESCNHLGHLFTGEGQILVHQYQNSVVHLGKSICV